MLQKSRGVLFLRSPKCHRQLRHRRTGLGPLKLLTNGKIHKMHAPQIQGMFFSEVAEAPEAAPTRLTGLGDPEPGYVDEVWVNFDTISEISMRSWRYFYEI
jgi:hypothetical protein